MRKNASQNHKIEFPLFLNSKQSVRHNCDEQFPPVYTASLHTDLAHGAKRKNLIKRYTLMKPIFKIFNLEEHLKGHGT